MKKTFFESFLAFVVFIAMCAEADGMNKTLTRNDSTSKLQSYSDEQKNQFHKFSPLEYVELAKNFSEVHGISPSLDATMRDEYDKTVGQLRKLGKAFGFKRYADIRSPALLKIVSVDSSKASWPELTKIIEDHADNIPSKFNELCSKLSSQLKTTGHPSKNDVDLLIESTVGKDSGAFLDISQLSPESEQIFRETLRRVFSITNTVISIDGNAVTGSDIFLKTMLLHTRSVLSDYQDLPDWFVSIKKDTSIAVPEIISIDVSFPSFKRVIEGMESYKTAVETPITDVSEDIPLTVGHLKWLYNTRFADQISRVERKTGDPASNESSLSDEDIELLVNITVGDKNRLFDVSAMSYRAIQDLAIYLHRCGWLRGEGTCSQSTDALLEILVKEKKFKFFYLLAGEENGASKGCKYIESEEKIKAFLEKFLELLAYTKEFPNLLQETLRSDIQISQTEFSSKILAILNSSDFFDPRLPNELKEFGRKLQQKMKNLLFPGDRDTFKSMLREVLRNSTGFQRVMSLLGGSIIGKDPKCPFASSSFSSLKIYFTCRSSSFTQEENRININMNDDRSEFDWTILHEISHAYHYIVGCVVPRNNDEWFVNFSVLNSEPINFIDQFYPVLNSKNMRILPIFGERYRYEEDSVYTTESLLKIAQRAIKYGFGNVLFDSVEHNSASSSSHNNRFLSRYNHLKNYVLPDEEDIKNKYKDQVWNTTEEMLTMQGIVPFMVNGKCIILEDRQNEHIFRNRKDAKEVKTEKQLEDDTYRVHTSNNARYSIGASSSLSFLGIYFGVDWNALKLDYYPQNTKFGEVNGTEIWSYKTGLSPLPDCLSYLYPKGRDINSYDLPSDLSLLASDIVAGQVDIKSIRGDYSKVIDALRDTVDDGDQKKIKALVDSIIKIGDRELYCNTLNSIIDCAGSKDAKNALIETILRTNDNSLYHRALNSIVLSSAIDDDELLQMAYKFVERIASTDNGVSSIVGIIAIGTKISIYNSILSKLNELMPNWKEVIKKNSRESFSIFVAAIQGRKNDLINVFLQDQNWLSNNEYLLNSCKDCYSDFNRSINYYIRKSWKELTGQPYMGNLSGLYERLDTIEKSSPLIEISKKLRDFVLSLTAKSQSEPIVDSEIAD